MRYNTNHMPHKKTFLIIAIVLGLFILAYIIAYSILGAMTVNKKTSDQEVALTKVENALGLTLTTLERDGKEAIELHVIKDGLAEKYGVKDGDLLATRSLAHFVQAAQTSQGKTFIFDIIRDGANVMIKIEQIPQFEKND